MTSSKGGPDCAVCGATCSITDTEGGAVTHTYFSCGKAAEFPEAHVACVIVESWPKQKKEEEA